MRLRNVEPGDLDAYFRLRCDPVMMAELGGPQPREGIEEKILRDVRDAAADTAWIKMIVLDDGPAQTVAGSVTLWSHEVEGDHISEIGWMVFPEHQGRGLGKTAVRTILEQARDQRRWGLVHAYPATTNAPSNGICRSVGFELVQEQDFLFGGKLLRVNHWRVDPYTGLRSC